jgi:DNA-binding FadR family transcriptional regulator
MFAQQSPERLEQLRLVAEIQSTESSNRIEGVIAPRKRIEELVAQKTTPQNRSEQEIAEYRDVLASIHANASRLYFTSGIVQQFHRDLYQFLPGEGGQWKGEIIIACPGVSQPTIRRVLDDLRASGQVRCIQKGKDAEWEKLDTFSERM